VLSSSTKIAAAWDCCGARARAVKRPPVTSHRSCTLWCWRPGHEAHRTHAARQLLVRTSKSHL
jgi:hypothetical protein